jgi:methylmalonyl-CoA mutase N-terminal domain/subunit
VFQYCRKEVPNWNTISISGYHIREAGSTAAQEVAFTLANAIAYIEAALKVGMEVDEFASQLSFFFNAHNNFFEEIAKFRAARRLYAKIMKDRFHAQKPESQKLRFHTQTAGSTLTAQQPENNVVRVTLQALAAVMGGTQSLHTNSMDEALWLPTEKSVQVALRTQQIIAYESGAADSIDPMAGSYLVEYLTDQIEQKAVDYIRKIDEMGGALKAIENGYMQNEIQDSAFATQRRLEKSEEVVVGVNKFQAQEEIELESLKIDPAIETNQREKLALLRQNRDPEKVAELLSHLESAAKSDENLMPLFIECVENKLTLGEICGLLRQVWGEYRAPNFI